MRDLYSQTASPNFSGTWVYDRTRSEARDSTKDYRAARELTVEHAGIEFKMEIRSKSDQTVSEKNLFYTDGRGEKFLRSSLGGQVESESRTVWERGDLVRQYSYQIDAFAAISAKRKGNTSSSNVRVAERYGLSADGSMLTISIEIRVEPPSTGVFRGSSKGSVTNSRHVYLRKT